MTQVQAIRTVEKIILENRENGELEGVLNRYRIAALNRLTRLAKVDLGPLARGPKLASPTQR